jgi:hypothetical protein
MKASRYLDRGRGNHRDAGVRSQNDEFIHD